MVSRIARQTDSDLVLPMLKADVHEEYLEPAIERSRAMEPEPPPGPKNGSGLGPHAGPVPKFA